MFLFTLKIFLAKNGVQQIGFDQRNHRCQHGCQDDELNKIPIHVSLLALRIRSPCFLLAIIVREDYRNIAGRLHFGKVREFLMRGSGEARQQDYFPRGREIINVDPWPGSLNTSTRPLCANTIAFTKLKPSPSPRLDLLRSPR